MQDKERELLAALSALGGAMSSEDDVLYEGTKFVLPEGMSLQRAIRFLEKKMQEDEEYTSFSRTFPYRPWDGAYAMANALKRAFGMVRSMPTEGMFGSQPPRLITIEVGHDEHASIPWGNFEVPMMPGVTITPGTASDPELGVVFTMHVEAPRKWRHHVEGLFKLVADELEQNSIYRGKAIDGAEQPHFLDLRAIDPQKVVYSEEVLGQLEANVWALLRWPEVMEANGVPLKRAVLCEGPYGTGKTLAAFLTAQEAVANGWTFVYARPDHDLIEVMRTARIYQPSVVFYEDVDTVADADNSEQSISSLLDAFDGIAAKGTKMIVVLTTNHVERIHRGMVRPGRLDAIIHVGELDRSGCEKLVRAVVPEHLLEDNINFDVVFDAMQGYLPAFVREAADRAVRHAIVRGGGMLRGISTADLVAAAHELRAQWEIMRRANDRAERATLDKAFQEVLVGTLDPQVVRNGE